MRRKIENCDTGKLTKDAGEYVVSELAREAIVSELNYLDIPLAELLGKKISGNPGFDFHSQNNATNTVIFGEAKYVTAHSGYPRAIDQIKAFVDDKKDIADIADCGIFVVQMRCLESLMDLRGLQRHFPRKAPLVTG